MKVKIELRPYTALGILSFCREFVNDSNRDVKELIALHENVDAFEQEVFKNISLDKLEDARLELRVNELTGRHPKK